MLMWVRRHKVVSTVRDLERITLPLVSMDLVYLQEDRV